VGVLDHPIGVIRGVGPATANHLRTLAVHTVRDLVSFLPLRYLDRSRIMPIASVHCGQDCLLCGILGAAAPLFTRGGRRGVSALLADESGSIRCMWFGSASWVGRWSGREVVVSGRTSLRNPPALLHPEIEDLTDERDPYLPVYRLTAGLTQRKMRAVVRAALASLPLAVPSLVDSAWASACSLAALGEAVRCAHFPPSLEQGLRGQDRVRLEALIPLQVLVARRRASFRDRSAPAMAATADELARFLRLLPFPLTRCQADALGEIRGDLANPRPMHRLLQGDVGSGKTVVAAGAAVIALAHGFQVALMAPTEVLADQHARVLTPWIREIGHETVVLSGGTSAGDRGTIHRRMAEGQPLLVIGTHALVQDSVAFGNLGLAIIDEQHRFGLGQRAALAAKGSSPHLLVMTATPIPRTLAMTVYGHLDLSVLSEKPPGRRPIQTKWYDHGRRGHAFDDLRRAVAGGIQAYVVAPLVEGSPSLEASGAVDLYHDLSTGELAGVRVGLVHGRMKAAEKDRVIHAFRAGEIQVLVCTTVVEVGMDAPGAGLLLVDGAERFGLSQLHQLRGRIGRGGQDAFCILLTGEIITIEAEQRIQAMLDTGDGFRLAEIDLTQRGPGALLGPDQHGRVAGVLSADVRLVALARECAQRIVEGGPPPGIDLDGLVRGFEDVPALGAG
jgi:ATP-dependent DNA helicase RecG